MTYATALAALADPTRRQIFEALRSSSQSVTDLARTQPVSRPAVSQHLKVLEEAGLVMAQHRGRFRVYSMRREGLDALREYLESFWSDALGAYGDHVNRLNAGN